MPHEHNLDGNNSEKPIPRETRSGLTWKPTGAGPGDFSQDEHTPLAQRAEQSEAHTYREPKIKTLVMRMDRIEPARETRSATMHGRTDASTHTDAQAGVHLAAATAPQLVTNDLHDPSSDDEARGEAAIADATMNRLQASALTDSTRSLSPTMLAIRSRLISHIIELNPTASHTFLQGFSPRQLRIYLDHLTIAKEPRGTVIRRRTGTPAIEAYRPSA